VALGERFSFKSFFNNTKTKKMKTINQSLNTTLKIIVFTVCITIILGIFNSNIFASENFKNMTETTSPTPYSANAINTSKANGNWSSYLTWSLYHVPTSTEDVVIATNVTYDMTGQTVASLTINSAKTLTIYKAKDLTVNGNVSNAGIILFGDYIGTVNSLDIHGNFTNTGTFTEIGNSRFYFSGTSAQIFTNSGTITATMNDLTVNNTNGLTISGNINILTLNMVSGNIDITGYTLTLGTSITTTGTLNYTSGQIITGTTGGFCRWFAKSTVSNVYFPVGTAANLNKITLSFTVAPTAGGTLTARFIPSNPGTTSSTSITDGSYTVNTYSPTGYWQLDNSGITGGTYNVGFEGQGFNVGGTSILNYALLRVIKRDNSSSNWQALGTYQVATGSNNDATAWRYGLTSFSTFAFGGNTVDNPFAGPLPVELSSFTSNTKGRTVNLNWSTASEQNNAGFQIERTNLNSKDQTWTVLGFVTGKNNSSSLNNYTYIDEKLQAGKYQYRMKQVDFNGNYKYYELNNVINIGEPTTISLSQNYPNPFNPVTKVDYSLPTESNVSIVIYDMIGRKVQNVISEHQQAGFYSIQINANNLSSGVYFYRLLAETNGQSIVMTKKMNVIK